MNVYELLALPAEIMPDAELLVGEGRRATYGEVVDDVDRLSAELAGLELGPGSVVGLLDVNTIRGVEVIFAAAKLGLPVAPLNYRARHDELQHALTAGGIRALVVGDRYVEMAVTAVRHVAHEITVLSGSGAPGTIDPRSLGGGAVAPVDVDDDALAALVFTSGTTSRPKAVELTHGQLSGYVLTTSALAVEPSGVTLLAVPLYHIAGLTTLLASTFGGRRIVLLPQFEAAAWLSTVVAERVTHAFLVPTMLKRVLDEPAFGSTDFSSLRVLSYGSAPMPLPVIREAIDRFPASVGFINAFGQTETTSTVTMLLPEDHRLRDEPDAEERRDRRLSSVGRPLPDVRLAILDDEGRELAEGEVGEVAVETTRAMHGYRIAGGGEAADRRGSWVRTGDLGYLDEDGYLFLVGRKGDMIIRGGENISPEEVERVLATHPAVEECAVVGIPDQEWGERVGAAVVLRPGSSVDADELREHCRARIASFKKPEEIRFVPELPRTSLGKLRRRDLSALFAAEAKPPA